MICCEDIIVSCGAKLIRYSQTSGAPESGVDGCFILCDSQCQHDAGSSFLSRPLSAGLSTHGELISEPGATASRHESTFNLTFGRLPMSFFLSAPDRSLSGLSRKFAGLWYVAISRDLQTNIMLTVFRPFRKPSRMTFLSA